MVAMIGKGKETKEKAAAISKRISSGTTCSQRAIYLASALSSATPLMIVIGKGK